MPYYYVKIAFDESIPDLPKYNPIKKNLFWVRGMDMGYKLVNEDKLSSEEI